MRSVGDSYRYCARLTRSRAKNFYYTFWFLPPERRQSIFAVYAFSRRADDTVDSVEEGQCDEAEARKGLAFLRSLLSESPPDDPLTPALQDTIRRFRIPLEPFEELLVGMEMDLDHKEYETFDELYQYCYRAASVVGLISIEIFGHDGPATHEPAVKLGIAMQLTNIIRDVAEDLQRGRRYVPAEDFRRFGYDLEELKEGVVDDRFRAVIRHQVQRAREYFKESAPLFPRVLPESRYCPVLLMRFYSRILDHVERRDYDVLRYRPSLTLMEKLRLAFALWRESRRAASP